MKSLRSTITALLLSILRNWKSDLEREGEERETEREREGEREREREKCRSLVDVMKGHNHTGVQNIIAIFTTCSPIIYLCEENFDLEVHPRNLRHLNRLCLMLLLYTHNHYDVTITSFLMHHMTSQHITGTYIAISNTHITVAIFVLLSTHTLSYTFIDLLNSNNYYNNQLTIKAFPSSLTLMASSRLTV